jgi:ABC-type nitrate/sulfonate/bicarbonate transport system substrate-binding protein
MKAFHTIAGLAFALAVAAPGRLALAQQDEATVALPALSLNFSPNYIAHDLGFWKDAGLDVKLTQIGGIGAMNAVLSRSVEFSNSSVATVIRANIRGQKVVALGTALDGIMQEIVLSTAAATAAGVTETSPMDKKAQALRGKKISIDSPNTLPHAFARYIARRGGVDPEREITFASMQPEAALAALKSGAIDAMAGGLPWSIIPPRDGSGILLASGVRGDVPELMPITNNMILTRGGFCDEKPTVCDRLMTGYARAAKFMHEKPKEAAEVLRKRMRNMDPELLEASFDRILRWTPKSTRINEAVFANSQRFMIEGGMLKPDEGLKSFSAIYTNKYAK